jgi:aminoglycoside 6'-N-acetyltransferase
MYRVDTRICSKNARMIAGERTRLRRARAADVDRLVGWHEDPETARFWDDETFTHEEMRDRLARADVEAWIVEDGDAPVGYLQVHEDVPLNGGIDMFLVPPARGRGLGPDAARAMTRHLLRDRGWNRVTVDPYTWNEQALRAWRNAGFVPVSHHAPDDEHAAAWVLMEYRENT